MDKIYKLLRNNRQTGPHTLEELVGLGLKPFDLIWADGKTAGWMYPSEIDALKPYLPQEQAGAVQTTDSIASPAAAPSPVAEPVVAAVATTGKARAVPSSGKHIFISMPAGAAPVSASPLQTSPVAEAGEETPEQKLERKAMELRQRVQALAETKKTEGEEPALDTKYARSLDDIKEEYTHWMHEQKHKSYGFRLSKKQWRQAALVLVVAGAGYGVFQWISMPATPEIAVVAPQATVPVPTVTTPTAVGGEEPAQSVINTDYSERNADLLTDLEKANRQIEEDLKRIPTKEKPAAALHKTEDPADADIADTYGSYEDAPDVSYESSTDRPAPPANTPVRTASVRSERKAVPLSQQIDVKAKYLWTQRNKGLSGLELALRNNSSQVLKTVAIDIFYYKEERLLDKKTVYFNDVQPGQSFTLTAPGNKHASSATYQLGLISSDGGLYVAKQ